MKKSKTLAVILLCTAMVFVTACGNPATKGEEENAESVLETLTLREKVGQIFFVRPDSFDKSQTAETVHASSADGVKEFDDAIIAEVNKYPAGGVVLFSKNIENPNQLLKLSESIKSASSVPMLLAVDEEGGLVARIANTEGFDLPKYPDALDVAKEGEQAVKQEGKEIGKYLKRFGFDIDFAPVSDVNSNPENPVIGSRAFSDDPNEVGSMVNAFLDGLHSENVLGCIKHFPGHGDTTTDSHKGTVVIEKTWEELLKCEIIPFKNALDNTDLIMTAHISLPKIVGDATPATLSKTILKDKLRDELGYTGVIITDALAMGAITDVYSSGEAAVRSFLSGADILLMPWDYTEAFEAVLKAVENGEISEQRLDESVLRILRLKEKCGLLKTDI